MKQTAVEYLVEQLFELRTPTLNQIEIIEQAKEMEKQHIIDAREDGHLSTYAEYGETPKCYLDGGHEQYYNETFKKK